MIRIPIPCKGQRFRLKLGIQAKVPMSLILTGKDAEHHHTVYVSRKIHFSASHFKNGIAFREFNIPFPLAPQFMFLEIRNVDVPSANTFSLESFEVEALEPKPLWEHPDVHRFIPFASWFAERAGYLPTGIYDSKDHRFLIEYLDVIKDEVGSPMVTPARTSRSNGRIQASRQHLAGLSVPIRWFILMHERKHFQLPTREEKVADLAALRVFLDFGFPKVEAIYACTLAMNANNKMALKAKLQRLKDIHAFVDEYMQQQQTVVKKAA